MCGVCRMLLLVLFCALAAVSSAYHKHEGGSCHTSSCTPASTTNQPPTNPVTRSPSGVFRGSWMETRRGRRFQAYRGIKYAEPPVGELRFKPPKPIINYKSEVDATQDGPACPLPAPDNYHVDEDCLTINVYTPDNKSKKLLPVIFYIHPGAFYAFTGRSDVVGPHYLIDRDCVFVAINYRLATLGFLATGDEFAPGNYGMKDQVAALKWVQRNIAAFGGNPDLVTLTGCSAGSISVMLHMISPMSKGLFHRAISLSGSPVNKAPTPTKQLLAAVKQAEFVNCPTNSNRAIYDCLKTKSWTELRNTLNNFNELYGNLEPVEYWWPVVEPDFGQERFLPIEPLDAIRQGKMHPVPYIISQTTNEFFYATYTITGNETLLNKINKEWERAASVTFQLPEENLSKAANRLKQVYLEGKDVRNDNFSNEGLGGIYRDSIIGFSVHRLVNLMARHSPHKVYYTEFQYVGNHSHYEDPKTGKPLPSGAVHHDDQIYLLSLSYRFPSIALSASDPDSRVVDQMTAMWYNFARYGDPNPRGDTPELGSLSWPAFTPPKNEYLQVGDQLSIKRNYGGDRYNVWEELYPIQY